MIESKEKLKANKTTNTINNKFFQVCKNGDIFSIVKSKKYKIGNIKNIDIDTALNIYKNKFNSIQHKLKIFISRINTLSPSKIEEGINFFDNELKNPKMIGDITSLEKIFNQVKEKSKNHIDFAINRISIEKKNAINELTKITRKMEKMAEKTVDEINIKTTKNVINDMLNAWKEIIRNTKNINKNHKNELYKRFVLALNNYKKTKNLYFKKIKNNQKNILSQKTALLEEAKNTIKQNDDSKLISTNLKNIQQKWNKVEIAKTNDDYKLFIEFRKTIDDFFKNKKTNNEQQNNHDDTENYNKKIEILDKVEKLLKTNDLVKIKSEWNKAQNSLDEIGFVSSENYKTIKDKTTKINNFIKKSIEHEWKNAGGVEKKNRISSSTSDLEKGIEKLENDLIIAKKNGNKKEISKLQSAITVKKQWLEQIKKIKL